MKRYTVRLIMLFSTLLFSVGAMAHGGHVPADTVVTHSLHRAISVEHAFVILAIGLFLALVLARQMIDRR